MNTREVLDHHLRSVADGELDEVLSDYVDESVLVTGDFVAKGQDAIRDAFKDFLAGTFKPGTYEFALDTIRVDGNIAFIIWHAKCASVDVEFASDTFLIRDGRIVAQTFAAKLSSSKRSEGPPSR